MIWCMILNLVVKVYINLGEVNITSLLYADDVVVLARSYKLPLTQSTRGGSRIVGRGVLRVENAQRALARAIFLDHAHFL